jgi:hypothetical protein
MPVALRDVEERRRRRHTATLNHAKIVARGRTERFRRVPLELLTQQIVNIGCLINHLRMACNGTEGQDCRLFLAGFRRIDDLFGGVPAAIAGSISRSSIADIARVHRSSASRSFSSRRSGNTPSSTRAI